MKPLKLQWRSRSFCLPYREGNYIPLPLKWSKVAMNSNICKIPVAKCKHNISMQDHPKSISASVISSTVNIVISRIAKSVPVNTAYRILFISCISCCSWPSILHHSVHHKCPSSVLFDEEPTARISLSRGHLKRFILSLSSQKNRY
jgi:hypothetical protein